MYQENKKRLLLRYTFFKNGSNLHRPRAYFGYRTLINDPKPTRIVKHSYVISKQCHKKSKPMGWWKNHKITILMKYNHGKFHSVKTLRNQPKSTENLGYTCLRGPMVQHSQVVEWQKGFLLNGYLFKVGSNLQHEPYVYIIVSVHLDLYIPS